MFIDFNKLKNAGFDINTHKNGITIEPVKGSEKLGQELSHILEQYSNINSNDAENITENVIKKVQVLEIIKVLSD